MKCAKCGWKKLEERNMKGEYMPSGAVSLALDFFAPGCVNCGEFFIDAKIAKELDLAVEKSVALKKLDLLIAEHVFGEYYLLNDPYFGCRNCPDDYVAIEVCPNYSSNIGNAWEVIDEMHSQGYWVLLNLDSGVYDCRIAKENFDGDFTFTKSAPLAICIATLKALNIPFEFDLEKFLD